MPLIAPGVIGAVASVSSPTAAFIVVACLVSIMALSAAETKERGGPLSKRRAAP